MRYTWIDDYLLQKRAVTKDLKKEWNWIRYQIGGKMFVAICLDQNDSPYYINLKLEPAEGEFLRSQYPDIIPGYYSDKAHWNSVNPDGEVPDELLMDLLDKSYHLVLAGFGKKKQREILGITCCGTECATCDYYKNTCEGCNETNGKVFHAPSGKACAIYQCCVGKHKFSTCAECSKIPCKVWLATKDPNLSQETFDSSIQERMKRLPGSSFKM
ncbi:MAG: hypothetical protein HFH88_14270 [Lachnospiraceae bacterium]|nr:hypothetical protein [Lachnospiraceae bacterium]